MLRPQGVEAASILQTVSERIERTADRIDDPVTGNAQPNSPFQHLDRADVRWLNMVPTSAQDHQTVLGAGCAYAARFQVSRLQVCAGARSRHNCGSVAAVQDPFRNGYSCVATTVFHFCFRFL